MKKICLLITMILSCVVTLQAFGQACTTPDNCGSTGYRPPYSPTGVYNENTTDSSNQYAVAYGRAMENGMAQKAAEDDAKKKKEELCKNKAEKMAVADAKAVQCKADAKKDFATKASDCTQITEATINIGGSGNVSGDVQKQLAAFNIKVGALIGGNIGGTLKWNPREDCRLKLADVRDALVDQCDADAVKTKAQLAGCP